MEYQTYVNESNLNSTYDFIPFGIRHDNPLYVTNSSASSKGEAIKLFNDFMMNSESQSIATKYGFNQNDDYTSDMSFSGSEVYKGLEVYKKNKDTGKDIIAVFVADCSGSMDGDPMIQLKESLSNGMNYINENNMVGLISYSHDVTIEVPIDKFDLNQKSYFQGAINNMTAGGGTSSYEAIVVAIDMVKKAKENNPDAKAMIFLLSDGAANGHYSLETIDEAVKEENIPIYTIGYGADADADELQALSNINEAASIKADSEDVIYKIKSLFNSSL
jgi:Ca-activated chloride channel family protein